MITQHCCHLNVFFLLTPPPPLAAHNAVVTSAIFAPHPDLIVPPEPGAEKPDTECKSAVTDESEPIPSGNACNRGSPHATRFVWFLQY